MCWVDHEAIWERPPVPFESFLHKTKTKRGKLFHATVTFSVLAHAGALAWATVHSFTVVEELAPPSVKLSFMHAPMLAPAPPPKKIEPPQAEGGQGQPRAHQALRPNVRRRPEAVVAAPPKPAEIVAPPQEAPAPPSPPVVAAAAPAATAGDAPSAVGSGVGTGMGAGLGVAGSGRGGGVGGPGGTAGGAPTRILPEALGKLQRLSGAAPAFPAQLAKHGAQFIVMTKVCVSASGSVENVDLMKRADPLLDANVIAAVKAWRYRPLLAGDTPVPFCTFVRFEFTTQA